MLTEFLTRTERDWDRGETVGASEIGQCSRRTAYLKHHAPEDDGYEESWGMMERGHWVEAWVVSRLQANGAPVHEAGDQQVTRSDGFLSSTPDGWFPHTTLGANISIDVKSFDPRKSNLPEPKHIVQTRLGAKLNPMTDYAMLIYVNASDFQNQIEFGPFPQLTDDELASLKERARDIMARKPDEHLREGYFDDECGRFKCPFRQLCIGKEIISRRDLNAEQLADLEAIQQRYAQAKALETEGERLRKMAQEDVRQLLQAAGTRIVSGRAWISRQSRSSLDTEAMERDGIDLAPYRKDGKPFDVITIRKPQGANAK